YFIIISKRIAGQAMMLNRLNPLKYSFLFWQLDQMTYDVMKDSQASVDLYEAGEINGCLRIFHDIERHLIQLPKQKRILKRIQTIQHHRLTRDTFAYNDKIKTAPIAPTTTNIIFQPSQARTIATIPPAIPI